MLNDIARYMKTTLGRYDEVEKLNRWMLEVNENELGG
jgi:hypothetical protein